MRVGLRNQRPGGVRGGRALPLPAPRAELAKRPRQCQVVEQPATAHGSVQFQSARCVDLARSLARSMLCTRRSLPNRQHDPLLQRATVIKLFKPERTMPRHLQSRLSLAATTAATPSSFAAAAATAATATPTTCSSTRTAAAVTITFTATTLTASSLTPTSRGEPLRDS